MKDELEEQMYNWCYDMMGNDVEARGLAKAVTYQAREYAGAISKGKIALGILIGVVCTVIVIRYLA
jgi:hypothetical protein